MNITNKHGLPQPIVSLLSRHQYSRGNSDISVTELIAPPQQVVLKRENKHKIVEDVSDRFWALMGQNLHKLLEDHANETVVTEERLFLDVNGWRISGQIDVQQVVDGTVAITDWKFTSVYSVLYPKPEWAHQLNLYAHLVEAVKGQKASRATVVAILRDWSKTRAKTPKYPAAPIVSVNIPLWPPEQRRAWLEERVALHQEARGSYELSGQLPECTDEERWVRKGTALRCKEYCPVSDYCVQYRAANITEEDSNDSK